MSERYNKTVGDVSFVMQYPGNWFVIAAASCLLIFA
jgi:hypothetical protein